MRITFHESYIEVEGVIINNSEIPEIILENKGIEISTKSNDAHFFIELYKALKTKLSILTTNSN